MKGLILPLVAVVAIAIPTMFGFIPVFLGVPAMLLIVMIKDIIFWVFARGLPMAIISTRMMGGLLWGVVKKTGEIVVDKFTPFAGWVLTKKHGEFNIMPERIYKIGGVPIGFAPEDVAHNVGFDHVQLVKELKKRGINDIRDIADVNEYNQIVGIKDDPRIKDLKLNFTASTGQIDLSGFNDFYRYCAEATNPYHQEAKTKLRIAQGALGREDKPKWLIYIGVMILLVGIGIGVLYMLTQGRGEQIVRIITDNGGSTVIPA